MGLTNIGSLMFKKYTVHAELSFYKLDLIMQYNINVSLINIFRKLNIILYALIFFFRFITCSQLK